MFLSGPFRVIILSLHETCIFFYTLYFLHVIPTSSFNNAVVGNKGIDSIFKNTLLKLVQWLGVSSGGTRRDGTARDLRH